MKKNVIVREYVDDDFESLIELYKNSLTYGGQYDEARDTRDKLLATAEDLCLFVAAADNEVIGSVMVFDNPHSFWLQRFCISSDITEESQNDVSRLLLDTTERIAQSRGHKSIIIYTNPDNENLATRYEQLSFTKGGQYSCFWKPIDVAKKGAIV